MKIVVKLPDGMVRVVREPTRDDAIRQAELRGIRRVVDYLEGAGLSGFWSEKVKTAFSAELEEYDG